MGWSHIRSFHHDFVFLFFFSSGSRSERLLRVYNWSPPFRALLKHLFFNYQFNCDLMASYKKWPRVRACPPCLIPKVWLYSGKKSISGRYGHIILCIAAYSDDKNQAVEDSVTVAMHSLSLSVSSLFLLLTFPLWPKIFFYYPQFFVFFSPLHSPFSCVFCHSLDHFEVTEWRLAPSIWGHCRLSHPPSLPPSLQLVPGTPGCERSAVIGTHYE